MTDDNNPIADSPSWEEVLKLAGEVVRPDGNDGDTAMKQTIARSYTLGKARHRLNLNKGTLEQAIKHGLLTAFIDPENNQRVPAQEIEAALTNTDLYEQIARTEHIKLRDIADALTMKPTNVRKRLRGGQVDPNKILWGQIRGRFNLPNTL